MGSIELPLVTQSHSSQMSSSLVILVLEGLGAVYMSSRSCELLPLYGQAEWRDVPRHVKLAQHRCRCWSSLGFLTVSAQPSHLTVTISPSPFQANFSTHWKETMSSID